MRMVDQCARPCVQSGQNADISTEIGGIGSDIEECMSRGTHGNRIQKSLVLPDQLADRLWQAEDDVEMWNRQALLHPRLDPSVRVIPHALGARAVPTRVVGVVLQFAVVAYEDMTAESRGPTILDRLHGDAVGPWQAITETSSVRRAESFHDIVH